MLSIRQLFKSMQFQLIFWSVLALLLLAIVAGGYGFWYSYKELNEFQDDSLESMSALIEQTIHLSAADNNTLLESNIHFDTDDEDGSITVDIINTKLTAPMISYSSHNNNNDSDNKIDDHKSHSDKGGEDYDYITVEDLPTIPIGISTKNIDGDAWRIYRNDSANNVIIVRQRTEFQDELAKSSALQSFFSLIIGMGFLTLLLPFIMWRMLKPVRQLQNDISQRRENDLTPLPIDSLPTELLPFVASLNRLLILVKKSIERQQRFIADAAHELRSPLTAISLQLQRLQRITDDTVMTEGLDKLAMRLKRNQQLVEQLLTLARAGSLNDHIDSSNIENRPLTSVKAVFEEVIGLLIPIIDNKNIELTVHLLADEQVNIDETSLLLVIKNIIQNAIVYTPNHGQVAITLFRLTSELIQMDNDYINNKGDDKFGLGSHVIHSDAAPITKKSDKTSKLDKHSKANSWLDNRLALQVMDTGRGISPKDYAAIFEPFVRLSQSNKPSDISDSMNDNDDLINKDSRLMRSDSAGGKTETIDGTGLGLSIVKSICEQVGIDVFLSASTLESVNDQDNTGLCVTLVFTG